MFLCRRLGDQSVEGARGDYPDRMSPGKNPQTDTQRSDPSSPFLTCLTFTFEMSECLALVLSRVRLSTPATPAATPCPVTPPAATAMSAGSTEENEEVEVASAIQQTQTPTLSIRGAQTTAVSMHRPTTTMLASETCPPSRPTSPCTALLATAALRSCPLEGAVVGERQGDENPRPSYLPQPIRIKVTGRGHSLLLAPVPIK